MMAGDYGSLSEADSLNPATQFEAGMSPAKFTIIPNHFLFSFLIFTSTPK
jgi:hypothetical protein